MKKSITLLLCLIIVLSTNAQKLDIDPAFIKLGWTFASPLILNKITDPLAKEIINKAIPKIIDQDVKGASYEIADAIYRIKNVKVLNKEFLGEIEKNINEDIKAIKRKDYVSAVNSLVMVVGFTENYIKTGILDKADLKPQAPIVVEKKEIVKNEDVNGKLHLDQNNKYLFFVKQGTFTEDKRVTKTPEENFNVTLNDGKKFGLSIGEETNPEFKTINMETFRTKDVNDKFKETMSKALALSLGSGQIIKSEITTDKYNFKALKYTYSYLDKTTSASAMAYLLVAFNNSTMFAIIFQTSSNDFTETKKSFEDFMEDFYIIGVDEIVDNTLPLCEQEKTGILIVSNSSTNPYEVTIDDGKKFTIAGGAKSQKINVKEGNHKLYTKQVSGFLMYPTEKTTNHDFIKCSEYTWSIPY